MNHDAFYRALEQEVVHTINNALQSGTTAMSSECLFQNLRLSRRIDAPRGANAVWQVRQVFNEILATNKAVQAFILIDPPNAPLAKAALDSWNEGVDTMAVQRMKGSQS